MTKSESRSAVRQLCHEWRKVNGYSEAAPEDLSFSGFFSWVEDNYRSYLRFRTTTSVRYDVEMWFDDEFKQNWRR